MRALNKEILRLAIPSILANITIPLVGLVDLAIAGHLSAGEAATLIGGISIGSMLFDLLYWNFGFLRVGTGGMTAQAWGRGDRREMASLLVRGVGMAFLIAGVMLLLQCPFVKGVFLFVDCSPQVRELAEQYFFIRIWAAPASLALMAFRGWFIGMQDSVSSMLTDLVVNGVNIVASILLARAIGFGGIAAGTVTAQYAGLLFAIGVVLAKYRRSTFVGLGAADFRTAFRGGELRKFMKINSDLFVRSLSMVAVYIGFTILSARYGDLMLATASILMKLLLLFSYFTDGFAYAGEALTGRFFGERNRDMVKELAERALENLDRAYVPYSHFHVSAALLAEDGRVFTGVNVENASYPAGICAERTAFVKAVSEGAKEFSAIAICGGEDGHVTDYCPPCGICRQVMREFCDPEDFRIFLVKTPEDYREYRLSELLPESFGPEHLKV